MQYFYEFQSILYFLFIFWLPTLMIDPGPMGQGKAELGVLRGGGTKKKTMLIDVSAQHSSLICAAQGRGHWGGEGEKGWGSSCRFWPVSAALGH